MRDVDADRANERKSASSGATWPLSEGGGALVIRGEAGIGKSAMLALAAERATAFGFARLATVGVETEAELAFAGLHQLLLPIVRSIELLPASQRQPLNAAHL